MLNRLRELDERVLGAGFYSLDERWARGDPPGRRSSERFGWFRRLDERVLGPVTKAVPEEPRGERARELWADLGPGVRDELRHAAAFGRVAEDPRDALIVADLISALLAKTEKWSLRLVLACFAIVAASSLIVVLTGSDWDLLIVMSAWLLGGAFGHFGAGARLRNVRDANLSVAGAAASDHQRSGPGAAGTEKRH